MHGETAAAAMYVRQLVKANKAGQPLDDIIENMNELINAYYSKSRPKFAAKLGMVDEIVPMDDLRNYMMAFTQAAYQNPTTICPPHQMLAPRCIREYNMYTQSGVSFRYYQKGCSVFNFAAAQLYFRAQSLVQQAVAAGALEMVI